MVNHPNRNKAFSVFVPAERLRDLLSHFGPDPVTRSWCCEGETTGSAPYVVEEMDKGKRRHNLTDRALKKGLRAFAAQAPKRFGDLMDEDRHDAPLADLFVQFCVFGEEKYG